MRIDPQNPASGSSGTGRVNESQPEQIRSTPKSAGNEPNDTVQLSSGQATVRQLALQLDQIPDIRQGEVNSLRSAIAAGKYLPGSGQVAEALASQSFGISELA
ncbi:MAG TPA: flagellar biosynthesis anti-sigma factor FlgM [Candidatus Acidoferrum sp.]|jgi:flagellar biosynthesis anti-sigma factor FlgM|nr:flagellar biosynthesis anti-sigma factor FlgM [Candidatus Acidoferrum sp.]